MAKKCIRLFSFALIALFVSAICLFVIPLVKDQKNVQFVFAGVFWLSIFFELLFIAIGNRVRRKVEIICPQLKQEKGFGKIGIFCFFQNKEAIVVDVLLLIFVAYTFLICFLEVESVWLILIGITTSFVFFHLHCILNGIFYKSIKHYRILIHKRRELK